MCGDQPASPIPRPRRRPETEQAVSTICAGKVAGFTGRVCDASAAKVSITG